MSDREGLISALKAGANRWDAYDFDPNYDYTEEAMEIAAIVEAWLHPKENPNV